MVYVAHLIVCLLKIPYQLARSFIYEFSHEFEAFSQVPVRRVWCLRYSWFQTFAVFLILYVFFWVFPRRLIVVRRRFGILYLFHLHRLDMKYISYPAYEDGTDRVFWNVGIQQSDAGEIPKRIDTRCLRYFANLADWILVCVGSAGLCRCFS